MNTKTKLMLILTLTIILSNVSGFVLSGLADTPPIGEPVTIDWQWWGQNSYYDLIITWTDSKGSHTETYAGWCADSSIYLNPKNPNYILISSNDPSKIPASAFTPDNWRQINILLNQWQTSTDSIYDVSWVHIQQAIWYFTDVSYALGDRSPAPYYPGWKISVNAIINDVITRMQAGEGESLPCAILCVPIDKPVDYQYVRSQLLFFMIPEIPLGTIGACITMVSAFLVKLKRTKNI